MIVLLKPMIFFTLYFQISLRKYDCVYKLPIKLCCICNIFPINRDKPEMKFFVQNIKDVKRISAQVNRVSNTTLSLGIIITLFPEDHD